MLEEALVLGREHGVHHHLGQILKPYDAAFFTGAVEQIRHSSRLDGYESAGRHRRSA